MSYDYRIAKIEAAMAGRQFYEQATPILDPDKMTLDDRMAVLERSMARFERLLDSSPELRRLLGHQDPTS